MPHTEDFVKTLEKQFRYYHQLADQTIRRLTPEQLVWQADDTSNSIAIIMKHMAGNMLSRWTDFLLTDGEKTWRNRDAEFLLLPNESVPELLAYWDKGWECLYQALASVNETNLHQTIYIRNEGHSVLDALIRQMAHYPYHVGQIVYVGKLLLKEEWISLSIPKGESTQFNQKKFSEEKGKRHFTETFLSEKK